MLLSNVHVNTTLGDVNAVYEDYHRKVLGGYDLAFPMENCTLRNKHNMAWMTPKLKDCIKKKTKLYLKGHISKRGYTIYKNRLTNVIRRAKAIYYEKLFLENAKNAKFLWSTINNLTNRKSCKVLKEIVADGGVLTEEPMVNYVNQYFVNAATNVTSGLPQTNGFICLAPRTVESCFFLPASITEVGKVIMNLKKTEAVNY